MGKIYLATPGAEKVLYHVLDQFSHESIVRVEVLVVDFAKSTLKSKGIVTMNRKQVEDFVEVDEDVARGKLLLNRDRQAALRLWRHRGEWAVRNGGVSIEAYRGALRPQPPTNKRLRRCRVSLCSCPTRSNYYDPNRPARSGWF